MFILFHMLLMTLGILCIITGVSAAAFFRRKRYWLKIHKAFNSSAGIVLSAGVTMAITAVWQQREEHFEGFHPVTGSIALGFTFVSLFLGFYQFKAGNRIRVVKTFHRWLGRFSVTLLIAALISGLIRAKII